MNKQQDRQYDSQTESLFDLPLTDEQSDEAKAGRGDERCVYVLIGTTP
jgi:hypothetical protein